ncbi:MAG: lysophospholipid acyltransferase family protein [Bacteroidales bacterium]
MILRAKHHFLLVPFFRLFSRISIRKRFEKVEFVGNFNDKQHPILLIVNHISWWDGFWMIYFNEQRLKRKFHFMMLEEQLRKHWIFNFIGGFSVKKGSRSAVESLNYTSELLQKAENLVLIFPQGKIQSSYLQQISFEKGIERILQSSISNPIQVLFVANLVDYFSKPKPTLTVYYEEYQLNDFSHNKLENSYNEFYQKCIETQLKREE